MPVLPQKSARSKEIISCDRARVEIIRNGTNRGRMLRITHNRTARKQPSEIRQYYYYKIANLLFKGHPIISFPKPLSASESKPPEKRQGMILSENAQLSLQSMKATKYYYETGLAAHAHSFRDHRERANNLRERIDEELKDAGIDVNFHPANVGFSRKRKAVLFDIRGIDRAKLEEYLRETNHPESERILKFLERAERRTENVSRP